MANQQLSQLGEILADTARDLAFAQVQGKPLAPIKAEGAARIAAHYQPKPCKGGCGELLTDWRFEYCSSCNRDLRGPFSFGDDE